MTDYPKPIADREVELMIAATPFARGTRRHVYDVPDDGAVVVKETRSAFAGANLVEHGIWAQVGGTSLRELFAEVRSISETGRFLIMERLRPVAPDEHHLLPDTPDWLKDVKPDAFGISETGSYKVCDYDVVELGPALAGTPFNPAAFIAAARMRRRFQF